MTQKPSLKIAYLCDMDPALSWTYSGGNSRIFNAVQSHVGDVTFIDNGWGRVEALRRIIHKLPVSLNIRTRWRAHYALSSQIAHHVEAQLQSAPYDAVMGVYSLHSMANLRVPSHMVRAFTSDATQSSYRTSEIGAGFGSYFKPGRALDGWVKAHETQTLKANDLNLWPSDWQKDAADRCYGLDPTKSVVLPWGANIPAPDKTSLDLTLGFSNGVRLLLVGRDWFAKGGPMVLETLRTLRERGVDARLSVVGTVPPDNNLMEWIDVYPNLDKSDPAQLATFEGLFRNSHFMVQPSLESYGFAFCEASAFALPSLCLRRGGIPVWDGVNGHSLPLGQSEDAFCDIIQGYIAAPSRYASLRMTSRKCYEDRLNWQAWGQGVKAHLTEMIAHKKACA